MNNDTLEIPVIRARPSDEQNLDALRLIKNLRKSAADSQQNSPIHSGAKKLSQTKLQNLTSSDKLTLSKRK
jgi:hypothetical protein